MKPIPEDSGSFLAIRTAKPQMLYVDKTAYLHHLVTSGRSCFFLARPRRFGKSLMITTLKEIFSGRKDLFEGLAIAQTDYEWKKHPVLHFNFGQCADATGYENFARSFAARFAMRALGVSGYGVLAAIYGLASATNLFRGVLQETAQRFLCFELGRERGDVLQVFSVALGVSMVFALAVGVFAETAGLWFVRGVMSIPDGMSVTAGRAYHLYVSLHVGRPLIWNENFNF